MLSVLTALCELTFSGIPSNFTYDVFKKAWKKITHQEWEGLFEALFVDAFERVLRNQRPGLLPFVRGDGVIDIDRNELRQILHQNLGEATEQITFSQATDEEKLKLLATAIAEKSVLILGGHLLSEYHYRELIHTLIQRVKNELKLKVLADPALYNRVMLDQLLENRQILTQLDSYCREQFNLAKIEMPLTASQAKEQSKHHSEEAEFQKLVFAGISVGSLSNFCWREILLPERPHQVSRDMQFKQQCLQYFKLAEFVEDVDLSLDVVLLNSSNIPLVLTSVGIEIVSLAFHMHGYGITRAERIKQEALYCLDLPDLRSKLMQSVKPDGSNKGIPPKDFHYEMHYKVPDPLLFNPGAVFRYEILLRSYIQNMPNLAVLRLLVMTNQGAFKSHYIHVSKF